VAEGSHIPGTCVCECIPCVLSSTRLPDRDRKCLNVCVVQIVDLLLLYGLIDSAAAAAQKSAVVQVIQAKQAEEDAQDAHEDAQDPVRTDVP
jgi:hypothetical protein